MKILQLDLTAYGPFTNHSLSLGEGEYGLHLIFGPNEAGKSSSLRALYHWLYGIPTTCADNFLHPYPALRIGGELQSANGKRLKFIRRKGQKNTLRANDDKAVVEDGELTGMLGGIDAATFHRQYGLSYEELKRGGRAVVEGGGDLGEILFSAGTGLADLGQVQKGLTGECELLFKKSGSKQRISQAIAELTGLRKQVRDVSLSTSEWVSRESALRKAGRQQQQLEEELKELRTRASRWERILAALPLIRQRRQLLAQLEELADVPMLPDNFITQRMEAQRQQRTQEQLAQEAEESLAALRTRIDGVDVPTEVLQQRTLITRLHTELGGYEKAARDRPQLVNRYDALKQQLTSLLNELGHSPDLAQSENLKISRVQRQRIQSLAGDWRTLTERENGAGQQEARLRAALKSLDQHLEDIPAAVDVTEVRRAIRRSQQAGDLDERFAAGRQQLEELEQQTEIALKQLRFWEGTLDELECLAVPSLETIERFENEFREGQAEQKRIADRLEESRQNILRIDQQLEQLRLQHDLPSEEDLKLAREQRTQSWQAIRQQLGLAEETDPARQAELPPLRELAEEFQARLKQADHVVDRLRHEAERVAEHSALAVDRRSCEAEQSSQQQLLESLQQAHAELRTSWESLWKEVRVQAVSPREMRSWVNQRAKIVELAGQLRQQRSLVDRLQSQIDVLRTELLKVLPANVWEERGVLQELSRLIERAEDLVSQAEEQQRKRQQLEDRRKSSHAELELALVEWELARQKLAAWRKEWDVAVAALQLRHEATPVEATSLLESIDQVFQIQKEMDELRERISGIDRDAGQFESSVAQLLEQVAGDLTSLPVHQSISTLSDRLAAATTSQIKLQEWNDALTVEQERLNAARKGVQHAVLELAELCRIAGCESVEALPDIEQSVERKRKLQDELNAVTQQLQHQAGGTSLDVFEQEAEGVDQDELKARLAQLQDEISRKEAEKTEVVRSFGEHSALLQQMNGSEQAAVAQEQAEQILAQIRADAEQYIRLRLASHLLQRTVDRFRDSSQGPVLKRACDHFSRLTLNAYSAIRPEYDDKGNAVLVGVRSTNNREVHVEGMSTGTCDQLYLALRLALLEQSLQSREPLPLIVDDILVMFDDQRAMAALELLVELSAKTQVILFTHHQHVVELARKLKRKNSVFIHSLNS